MTRGAAVRRAKIVVCLAVFAAITGLLLSLGSVVVRPPAAVAATSSAVSRGSAGVTADALPTVQINGIVWTQVIVGNTVYAGGRFSAARPAGAAPGESTVARSNLLAFDIRSGELTSSFAPEVNGTVRSLAVSPDKKTLYIGGAFTAVNGKKRLRFAVVATGNGSLKSLAPAFNDQVRAIVSTTSTVYVGGQFTKVGKSARSRLAALNAKNGRLRSWKPKANSHVYAMTLTPDRKAVVAGGRFSKVGKTAACGMSRLSLKGKVLAWPINTMIKNCAKNATIVSLTTDATRVYGSGYSYGGGNFEGVFAATGAGKAVWFQDCRGDTYDVAVARGRVYSVGHAHNCGNIGGFPEAKPRMNYRALAVTTNATGTVGTSAGGYKSFRGQRSPSMVNWFPNLTPGTITGQTQAAWSVVAAGDYVVLGGEFTAVNGTAQQGLVRMATNAYAPRKEGPRGVTLSSATPKAVAEADGSATISWPSAWDRDDQTLTYTLLRDGVEVYQHTSTSRFWEVATMSFQDTSLSPGVKYRWQLQVSDPDGNVATSFAVAVTMPQLAEG